MEPNQAQTAPVTDSAAQAPAQVPATAPQQQATVNPFTNPAQQPQVSDRTATPPQDSSLNDQLATAEKRVKDTQSAFTQKAQEAAQLKSQLQQILNHPAVQAAARSLIASQARTAETTSANVDQTLDAELQAAYRDYQSAPSDEAAFARLVTLAEQRATKKAKTETEQLLERRDAEAALYRRNVATVDVIHSTVQQTAPDIPMDLFWAMAPRAEAETPSELTNYSERLAWQTERAIELSRAVLTPRVAQAQSAAQQQSAVTRNGMGIMAPGGQAPSQVPNTGSQAKSMVDIIKERQSAMMVHR